MKKYISDKELLSAYIDGELSTEEQNAFEQKLNHSAELRGKLEEMQKLKELTKLAAGELPESPYFETRFFAELKSSKSPSGLFKKYIPVLGFTVLAVIIMVVLKFNPDMIDNLLEEQKTNIAGFYKENLKPLLYAANLTNEDVFNFAFSNRLPLDERESHVLLLGYDDSGKEFFEIKALVPVSEPENNLERFVKALNLNEKQRWEVDSILDSYADELQTQVFVSEKNTIAINPNLWNYNKAIAAELLSFADANSSKELRKIIPASYTLPEKRDLRQYVNEIKTSKDNNYIFFTPDSIFSEIYEYDKGKLKIEIQKMKKELQKELKELDSDIREISIELKIDSAFTRHKNTRGNKNFRISVDSNSCRVVVPHVKVPDFKLPMLDSLNIYLDDLAEGMKNFQFEIEVPDAPDASVLNFRIKDSVKSYNFSVPFPNTDSMIQNGMDSLMIPYMFHLNPDSLINNFRFFMNDSLNFFNSEEFKKELEELEKEMRHFREDMNELRMDMKKEQKKKTIKKDPIEI